MYDRGKIIVKEVKSKHKTTKNHNKDIFHMYTYDKEVFINLQLVLSSKWEASYEAEIQHFFAVNNTSVEKRRKI